MNNVGHHVRVAGFMVSVGFVAWISTRGPDGRMEFAAMGAIPLAVGYMVMNRWTDVGIRGLMAHLVVLTVVALVAMDDEELDEMANILPLFILAGLCSVWLLGAAVQLRTFGAHWSPRTGEISRRGFEVVMAEHHRDVERDN